LQLTFSDFKFVKTAGFHSWKDIHLDNLITLNLEKTTLLELPEGIFQLHNLRKLSASNCKLINLSTQIATLSELETLDIGRNQLTRLPNVSFSKLESIVLNNNKLESLPPKLFDTTSLVYIDADFNKLVSIPTEIENLKKLKFLVLSNNQIQQLPDTIGELPSLVTLSLQFNNINVFPKFNPDVMTNLKSLNASCNQIEVTPEVLLQIDSLKEVNLRLNKITTISDKFKQKTSTTFITSLPDQILPNLYLGSEECTKLDAVLLERKITHILRVMREGSPPVELSQKYTYKVIQVGDKESEDISNHFDTTYEFIHNSIQSGGAVLIHCAAGVSRSATIVSAYVMRDQRMKSDEAVSFVKSKRPQVNPNRGFLEQLKVYDGKLNN